MQEDKLQEGMELKRQYVTLVLEEIDFKEHGPNVLKILEKHASTIRQVDVKQCRVLDNVEGAEYFIKFINAVGSSLEKIAFEGIGRYPSTVLSGDEILKIVEKHPINVDKLSKVVMSSTSPLILRFVENAKIMSLKQDDLKYEKALLKNLPHLEELALHKFVFDGFGIELAEISCPLKRLSLLRCRSDDENTLPFMGRIKETLEELEVGGKLRSDFFKFVFKELNKLQVLKINMKNLPHFQKKLEPNKSVKTLILYDENNFDDRVHPFIENCPNVETLVMKWDVEYEAEQQMSNEQMIFIADSMPKLRILQLRSIKNETFENVNLPELRELHILFNRFVVHYGWEIIAKSCPNLETLVIRFVQSNHFCSPKAISVITQEFKKLQHLDIGNSFYAVKGNFIDLMENCADLKSVRLKSKALRDDPTMADEFTKSGKRLIFNNTFSFRKDDGEIDFDLWSNEEEYWPSWDSLRSVRNEMGADYEESESTDEDYGNLSDQPDFYSDEDNSDEDESDENSSEEDSDEAYELD